VEWLLGAEVATNATFIVMTIASALPGVKGPNGEKGMCTY
jgi:hypothetical protein